MLRGVMMSSLICDCDDSELELKLSKLSELGVNFISSLLTICRPRFCEYPYRCVSGRNGDSNATYDLMQYSQRFFDSLGEKINYFNRYNIGLQLDILSAVTFKRDYMCYKNNTQGIVPSMSLATARPTGAWSEVLDGLCRKLVPYLNNISLCAVLGSLEGNAQPLEMWLRERLLAHGLKREAIFVTNCGTPGMVNSPHLHSVSAFKKFTGYASSDGWCPTAAQWRQCVESQKKHGSPAIELYHWAFSADNEGDYGQRGRPSAAFIAAKCGGQLKELVR